MNTSAPFASGVAKNVRLGIRHLEGEWGLRFQSAARSLEASPAQDCAQTFRHVRWWDRNRSAPVSI